MTKLSILFVLVAGCGSSNSKKPDAMFQEVDAAIDSTVAPDCFMGDPQTHDQIINACPGPGVTRIFKTPTLPLMNPDGSLPPLP